jgi:hypothetical protein
VAQRTDHDEEDPLAGMTAEDYQRLACCMALMPIIKQAQRDLATMRHQVCQLRLRLRRPTMMAERRPRCTGRRPRARRRSGARRAAIARDDGDGSSDGPGEARPPLDGARPALISRRWSA